MCLLVDFRWYEDIAVFGALHIAADRFKPHLDHLGAAGYLEIRIKGRRTKIRITPLGLDQLTAHMAALQTVANEAASLVATRRASLESSRHVDPPTPDPASEDL